MTKKPRLGEVCEGGERGVFGRYGREVGGGDGILAKSLRERRGRSLILSVTSCTTR